MADYNRNWNQSHQSDENWDRDRRNEDYRYNQENRGSFGNASYGQDDRGRNYGQSGYKPASSNRNYSEGQNERRDWDNIGQGYRGASQDHGAYSSDYGYQSSNYDQGSRRNERNYDQQRRSQWDERQGTGNYGGYSGGGREDWGRANVDTGSEIGSHNIPYYGTDYGRRHERDNDYNDYRRRSDETGSGYRRTGYSGSDYMNRPRTEWRDANYGRRDDYRDDRDRSWWDRTRDEVSSWFGDDDAERRRRMDDVRESGGYRGRGPKQYQRSSDRIREDVCDRLSDDDHVDASNIDVKVEGNEVILTGTVNSRYEKRHAEDLVESISGVRNVENRIRVARPDDTSAKEYRGYTGTTDSPGGIGRESGTTNEVARNVNKDKNK